ncbi:MAG: DUF512 domain-containing protein [Gemmatimonadetes bacterium]|jgi:putative radical SAM enzyme (TIGR03279 family)|nr:DUF512 domain-containing protein [Gemmatimonadota bacterium]MBT6147152.1 DUF512 domain-containing protein [Gemmatimonadota bacterium]
MIVIKQVEAATLAARAGFESGDRIVAINGAPIDDLIDFQVASSDAILQIEVEREGQAYEFDVERRPGETFGLEFDEMRLRRCNNKCVFCFLHQMPAGMRRSLYFEDDDFRLSFLHGSYVTLTNVRDADLQRIIDHGLSPQYLSVHATDPDLREKLLGRRQSTVPILERIQLLADNDIQMHCQVVLCPGWNDGEHLETTLRDLREFHPAVGSVALVPVGLTKFREHLPSLDAVKPEKAQEYLDVAERWGEACLASLGERFVYAADELFLLTGQMPPVAGYYHDFPQIENGIGMVRTLLDGWQTAHGKLASLQPERRLAVVTGRLAARFLAPLVEEARTRYGLPVALVVVDNDFFGHGITVSGLLTGQDIARALKDGPWDVAVVPPNCINGDGVTLDDMTMVDLAQASGLPVAVGDYDLIGTLSRCLTAPPEELEDRGKGRQLSELGFFVGRRDDAVSEATGS